MSNAPAFSSWLDTFFEAYYRRRPVNATFIGVHAYDHLLPDYSPAAVTETVAELEHLLQELNALTAEPLSQAEQFDQTLARNFLEIQLWEFASRHFQGGNPCTYTGEAIFGLISLFLRDFAPIEQRVHAAISRMHAIPALLEQGQYHLQEAPREWITRAIRECDGAAAFLSDGIERLIQTHGLDNRELRAAAAVAAGAFAQFHHFLLSLPALDTGYAAGESALAMLIERGHLLDLTPSDIAARARSVIEESRQALEAGAADFGANNWQDALTGLADLHPSVEDYYARYGELWQDCYDLAAEKNLLTWPEYPLRYVPQPEWARTAAPKLYFLFYRAPAAFDQLAEMHYLVTPIEPEMPAETQQRLLRATNDSVIKLNHVVHHGSIGHHVQNWHAYRAASRIGQIAAIDCASRIAMFSGATMAEGWSSYVTDLMGEVGFLTPLERYSQHHARLRMAARALADVELHSGRMTLDQVTALYTDVVGMSADAARAEAVKNSMFPGAALIYLMGVEQIQELRKDLAEQQGEAFSLAAFHDQFLSYGSLPVALIAQTMRAEAAPTDAR